MTTHAALATVRREIRMLAIAAATDSIRDQVDKINNTKRRRGHADILRVFDETANQLAAPGLAAVDEIERGLSDGSA